MCKYLFFCLALLNLHLNDLSSAETNGAEKKRILVGSPIRQKPAILKEFLDSFKRLEKNGYTLDYYFTDDNVIPASHELLQNFAKDVASESKTKIVGGKPDASQYDCNEVTHCWKESLVWKVAGYKDEMFKYALQENYDYIFLIDSDIVLHPKTIDQLIADNKDIVSNIFWTSWTPGSIALPQVWLFDHYTLYHKDINEEVSDAEANKRTGEFLDQLKVPGVYEVGGLGACTLISRHAMEKGVNFKRIKNLTMWGEDRHFCIRALALGLELNVDTHYPAYHIYRESALDGVEQFKKESLGIKETEKQPKITLMMIMRNESGHYLKPVLESAREYIDEAVIIDDASTDDSVQVCREVLKGIPLYIIQNAESKFSNEINLRKQSWDETVKTNPEWILCLDADQIFEKKFNKDVKELVKDQDVDAYYFRLYDMWDDTHYRDDQYWQAHNSYRTFLIRYKPDVEYNWKETAQHCGHFPLNVATFPMKLSNLRLKHYGWAKLEDRLAKYKRYQQLDPEAKFGWKEQYDSILDEDPKLALWIE